MPRNFLYNSVAVSFKRRKDSVTFLEGSLRGLNHVKVKQSLYQVQHYAMKKYGGVEIQLHIFYADHHAPTALPLVKQPRYPVWAA
jgi:hypothetical protein